MSTCPHTWAPFFSQADTWNALSQLGRWDLGSCCCHWSSSRSIAALGSIPPPCPRTLSAPGQLHFWAQRLTKGESRSSCMKHWSTGHLTLSHCHGPYVARAPGAKEPQEVPWGPRPHHEAAVSPPCLQRGSPQTLGNACVSLFWQVMSPLGLLPHGTYLPAASLPPSASLLQIINYTWQ